jgi:predicted DNA-binding transcriptional regulator AlpA
LLTAEQSAAETGLSLAAFWKGVAAERFPAPVYPAPRAPRWRLSELNAALERTRALPSEQKAKRREAQIKRPLDGPPAQLDGRSDPNLTSKKTPPEGEPVAEKGKPIEWEHGIILRTINRSPTLGITTACPQSPIPAAE